MKVLIIEDELLAAERLEGLIRKHDPKVEIASKLDSVKESVEFLKSNIHALDLIFMDIQLADGKSLDIFREVDVNKPVIFTTAYDQYSLEAFQYNSIHYLLKPIKYKDLTEAINKYSRYYSGENKISIDASAIHKLLNTRNRPFKSRFLLKYGNRLVTVPSEDIAVIFIIDKVVYCKLFGDDKKSYIMDHTLEELDQELLDNSKFFRVNRKMIININSIRSIAPYKNHRLNINSDPAINDEIIVSREKVSEFRTWLDS